MPLGELLNRALRRRAEPLGHACRAVDNVHYLAVVGGLRYAECPLQPVDTGPALRSGQTQACLGSLTEPTADRRCCSTSILAECKYLFKGTPVSWR